MERERPRRKRNGRKKSLRELHGGESSVVFQPPAPSHQRAAALSLHFFLFRFYLFFTDPDRHSKQLRFHPTCCQFNRLIPTPVVTSFLIPKSFLNFDCCSSACGESVPFISNHQIGSIENSIQVLRSTSRKVRRPCPRACQPTDGPNMVLLSDHLVIHQRTFKALDSIQGFFFNFGFDSANCCAKSSRSARLTWSIRWMIGQFFSSCCCCCPEEDHTVGFLNVSTVVRPQRLLSCRPLLTRNIRGLSKSTKNMTDVKWPVMIRWLLVVIATVSFVSAFNVDIPSALTHRGPAGSYFGFSVDLHKDRGLNW